MAEQAQPPAPHPALNAMLVCDQTIREEGTGKVSLIGIFEEVRTAALPAKHPALSIYTKLTDAAGDYSIRLEIVRLDDLKTVAEMKPPGKLHIEDRNASSELVVVLQDLVFERPGRHEIRLYMNDRWVGSKALTIVKLEEAG